LMSVCMADGGVRLFGRREGEKAGRSVPLTEDLANFLWRFAFDHTSDCPARDFQQRLDVEVICRLCACACELLKWRAGFPL
jgi:hypothetical protein